MFARRTLIAAVAAVALCAALPAMADDALNVAISGSWRGDVNKARDQYRHPTEALAFWGLKPGMAIVEIDPGPKGWWTEILAPYAKATGGHYRRPA